jgi:hypothetical protein
MLSSRFFSSRALALFSASLISLCTVAAQAGTVTFEELSTYSDSGNSYYNGDTGAGSNSNGWSSQGAFFSNNFTQGDGFSFWGGMSYSNVQDPSSIGFTNQYASFTGGGANLDGSVDAGGQYGIGFPGFGNDTAAFMNLTSSSMLTSIQLTNTTYTALSVRDGTDGSGFVSGPFGSGQGGLDPDGNDFLKLTISGYDGQSLTGNLTSSIDVYLADYRDNKSDNDDASLYGGDDYVLDQWLTKDLSVLGNVRSIGFSLETTDIGQFGPNTPGYFAFDNIAINAVPEPGSIGLLATISIGLAVSRRRRTASSSARRGL